MMTALAWSFTVTSAGAVIALAVFMVRVEVRMHLYKLSGRNGDGLRVIRFLRRLIGVRQFCNVCLLGAGVGALTGHRWAVLLIALNPLVTLAATFVDIGDL